MFPLICAWTNGWPNNLDSRRRQCKYSPWCFNPFSAESFCANTKINISFLSFPKTKTGDWFDIKMPSYQHRKSHCGDKTILRPSYLHNRISYIGTMVSLYWIRAQIVDIPPRGPSHCHDRWWSGDARIQGISNSGQSNWRHNFMQNISFLWVLWDCKTDWFVQKRRNSRALAWGHVSFTSTYRTFSGGYTCWKLVIYGPHFNIKTIFTSVRILL